VTSPTFARGSTTGEKRLEPRQLPVDGYLADNRTLYEFHDCYWHCHRCWLTAAKFSSFEVDPDSSQSVEVLKLMQERRERTEDKSQYLESLHDLTVVAIGEC